MESSHDCPEILRSPLLFPPRKKCGPTALTRWVVSTMLMSVRTMPRMISIPLPKGIRNGRSSYRVRNLRTLLRKRVSLLCKRRIVVVRRLREDPRSFPGKTRGCLNSCLETSEKSPTYLLSLPHTPASDSGDPRMTEIKYLVVRHVGDTD